MRISQLYAQPAPTISFEFFPPKTDAAEKALVEETSPALAKLGASFFSVTYGAGGSTHDRSFRVVQRIRAEVGVEAMAHVTCVGATRETATQLLSEAHTLGIENILALRGDPPKGQTTFQPVAGGFSYAIDLVRLVKSQDRFGVGVAGYPEGHVECPDKYLDWDRCAAKVEAGAEFILTQLFYDPKDFLEFEDYLRNKHGVRVPIVPGILPFLTAEQIKRFTSMCGSKLPSDVLRKLEDFAGDDESVRQLGVEVCTNICRQLLDHGIPGIHFYCLNRVPSCREIMHNLKLSETTE